ncbi:retrovirus-related pol polyprotein from transposon TNT 1-94, partial [Tanacetum coccineum]
SKPVTPYYLPKVQEYVLAKPHHMITPGLSRNSQEESYGSNDMAHNHYLEEARWKPTGKIFTAVGLKWIPKGKLFESSTSKVDSEPPNGSNDDNTKPYECDQTLNVSADTLNLSAVQASDLNVIKMASADNTSDPALQRKERSKFSQIQMYTPSSTFHVKIAPSPSHSPSSLALQSPSLHQGVAAESTLMEDNPFALVVNNPFINVFAPEPSSEASSFGDLSSAESPYVSQTVHHLEKLSKDHSLDNIISNPSQPISTRKQLATDALWCLYNSVLSKVEPNNFNFAIIEDCWFQAMQDEIHEFDRLQVWELVSQPDRVMNIALKWIYKVKLDEYGDVLKNKARYG